MTDEVVVDTDVASFLFREDSRAEFYSEVLKGKLSIISFQTIAETNLWALTQNWGTRRRHAFDLFLERFFVHDYEPGLAHYWALVNFEARRAGRPIDSADAWIAATALALDCPLVTNNAKDYEGVGSLRIITAPG